MPKRKRSSSDDTPRLWKATQAFINKPKKEKIKPSNVIKNKDESIQQFSDRIEAESRKSVNLAAKKLTRKYEKNKEYQTRRMEKKRQQGNTEPEFKKIDVIPFGTQVKEPPKIKIVPKMKADKKRVKLKDMSERDRIRLIAARSDIIQKYRDLKKSKSGGYAQDEDDLEGYDQEDLIRKFRR